MKIVLSTDYHLKFSTQFDRVTERGLPSRLEEIIDSVNWVVETGKKHRATTFVGLGDIFDASERLNTKEGLAIMEMFQHIKAKFANNFFLVGNHDQISAEHNILDLFSSIVKVYSKPSFVDVQGARLFFLPYIRESEDVYKALKGFEALDCPGKKYAFCHFWDSSVMSVDPEAIDLSKVNVNFFDRIFLGHHHVPTSNLASKVVYVGTLLNKKFNETGPKGCWILDTETNHISFYKNPHSPEFFQAMDTTILTDIENLETNAYYRVACSPENVLEVSKILSKTKGFELISKQSDGVDAMKVSILNVEKKNATSLKDYIFSNCSIFTPPGISEEEFKKAGTTFLSSL